MSDHLTVKTMSTAELPPTVNRKLVYFPPPPPGRGQDGAGDALPRLVDPVRVPRRKYPVEGGQGHAVAAVAGTVAGAVG